MGGIARLAMARGFRLTGSDQHCYPPMSEQLESLGIELHQGYDALPLQQKPDCVIVGNALTRGVPVIEALLESQIPFRSGPQWLSENVLHDKWVIAAAGTHGKTTTASMVAWILEANGYDPGFLIGGVPENFAVSARLTDSPFFVVEADEYDTAFFDKRSKFVHYRSRTCILNNLEFDHADIFANLAAIETQFHHLLRTVPGHGLVIRPEHDPALDRVIERGCWTPQQTVAIGGQGAAAWRAVKQREDGSCCEIYYRGERQGQLRWALIGDHNLHNALAALAACHHVGVSVPHAIDALADFRSVKRRMELRGSVGGISIYDDFAHHPTAIEATLRGLRAKVGNQRIIAVVDPRSNTMKMGLHKDRLLESVRTADMSIFHQPAGEMASLIPAKDQARPDNQRVLNTPESIVAWLRPRLRAGDQVVIMSNGGFGGIHQQLIDALAEDAKEQTSHE